MIMCWHVSQPGFAGLYMVDGTIRDVSQPEVYERIVTEEHARSGRFKVLCVSASIAKTLYSKLDRYMTLHILPMQKD